ncbi:MULTISPECIES: hypothetical protein [Halomonadaceae]|uniref:hypothetical protein n=1 Tax=Halomonadaceae TaxID=28256 RepID=UPI00059AB90C|nr:MULTISPECIES: hypothetical protein [unclassified Halomonas]KIN13477.1 hypothetical protein RO22_19620 [Halomonas sp. KHS3]|tara:strand:+ start:56101 stop:56517 length:417 start_codon:yes stop_codon:yes gene_type:complete
MIASLQAKAIGLVVGGLALLSAFLYWQHITSQRDAYHAEAERQRSRAEILQEHQQWQRQQIETLSNAMVERDRKLSAIAEDISASTAALDQLGEQNAEIRAWLDRDLPVGIGDWVRELQRPADGDAVQRPDSTRIPHQ